ncbi:hypothetical protein ABZ568_25905 [Streptomyces olindensis]|uniref:Uncharacterized protein n=1 Tax=Streptomyces olindensis TaxID=358823 RepID=A0ABV2Y0J5_9ACTN|nr:hypothetical protein DF19_07280 [Streptomyces olindensis]
MRQTPSQGLSGAYEVRVAVTGPAGAGEALAQLLADQEALEPASVAGPVPSREVPDAVVTYMAGRPDVFTPTTAVQEGSDA